MATYHNKTDERFTFIQNGNLDILVATDVAARGLDISGVTMSITTIFHKIQKVMFTVLVGQVAGKVVCL